MGENMLNAEIRNIRHLNNRWVAIDPRGGEGLVALRNGSVVVDFDADVGDLCARLEEDGRSSLEICFCPACALSTAA
jgi:hypothetical protein